MTTTIPPRQKHQRSNQLKDAWHDSFRNWHANAAKTHTGRHQPIAHLAHTHTFYIKTSKTRTTLHLLVWQKKNTQNKNTRQSATPTDRDSTQLLPKQVTKMRQTTLEQRSNKLCTNVKMCTPRERLNIHPGYVCMNVTAQKESKYESIESITWHQNGRSTHSPKKRETKPAQKLQTPSQERTQ